MSDLISRQEIIELIEYHLKHMPKGYHPQFRQGLEDGYCRCMSDIRLMPSAQPERKKGRWIYEGKRGRFPACRCSECGNVENADWAILGDNVNYCPNCGADMRGEEEDEKIYL